MNPRTFKHLRPLTSKAATYRLTETNSTAMSRRQWCYVINLSTIPFDRGGHAKTTSKDEKLKELVGKERSEKQPAVLQARQTSSYGETTIVIDGYIVVLSFSFN